MSPFLILISNAAAGQFQEDVFQRRHPHGATLPAEPVAYFPVEVASVLHVDDDPMAVALVPDIPFPEESREIFRGVGDLKNVAADMAADQLFRLPLDEDASLVHNQEPVAEAGGLFHVVGRQQDREPAGP